MGARISQDQSSRNISNTEIQSSLGSGPNQSFNILGAALPGYHDNFILERARSLSSPDMNHMAASSGSYSNINNNLSQSHLACMPRSSRFAGEISAESVQNVSSNVNGINQPTYLPSHMWSSHGIKCPVCTKLVLQCDIECHLLICLTTPRLSYNEDILTSCKGECVICLENLESGDTIARLPCLCIYHKGCIDRWFEVNRCCPEHPGH